MTSRWKTFGHEQTKQILERQIAGANFPHAYLFSGPSGIGKKTLALELAQKILGAENLLAHADFQMLDQTAEITVEQIRQIINRLSLKPLFGQKKVTIVNNAELMNTQSANALLKTLEEPSPSTIIILVGSARAMLPTIVSRCQVLNMEVFSLKQLQIFAESQNLKVSSGQVSLSYGCPAELLRLAQSPDYASEKEEIARNWQSLRQSSLGARFLAIGQYADMETESLENLMLSWLFGEELNLEKNPRDFPVLTALLEALSGLRQSLNKKSVLQTLFLKI